MTVRKYRFISFQFSVNGDKNINIENSVIPIIRDKVNENYGEILLYRLQNLLLIEYLRENNIFVIRVDRDISKEVIFSLTSSGRINDLKCNFRVLFVSGILKKLLSRLRNSLQNSINNIKLH